MSDSGKLLPVTAIKTMKLYSHFERVDNELRAKGFKDGDSLTLEALQNYDHMNYRGQEGVRVCINQCQIGANSCVLDVGSGLGGPARLMAHLEKSQVVALGEL